MCMFLLGSFTKSSLLLPRLLQLMVTDMKGRGKMVRRMEKASSCILTKDKLIKDTGQMT